MKAFKVFLFVLFFSVCFLNSQENSGKVIYRLQFETDFSSFQLDAQQNQFKQDIEKAASQLNFELIFDQTNASFGLVKNLSLDTESNTADLANFMFGGKSTYFTNLNDRQLYEQKEFLDKKFLIKTSYDDLNWSLTNESKEISGFQCYKAVSYREVTTGPDTENKNVEILAWYCPEIPVNFGPFEAVGLPGLVLEFSSTNHSYVASKINLGEDVTVEVLDIQKSISQNEFDEILKKKAKN